MSSNSLLSNVSLIAGTTIGAGILALPAVTMPVGLLPSTILMVAVWLYMALSGLLVAEANVYVRQQAGQEGAGLLATIDFLLGRGGAIAAGVLYLFIHYALLVAYTARGGDILAMAGAIAADHFHAIPTPSIPLWCGHVLFSALLAALLFFGKESFVGRFNTLLLLGVITAFFSLVALILSSIEIAPMQFLLQFPIQFPIHFSMFSAVAKEIRWAAIGTVVPVMFVAFVYHNVVPVVAARLLGDRRKICQAILLGSLVPLLLFLLWNAVILLSVGTSVGAGVGVDAGAVSGDPIEQLQSGVNGSRLGVVVSIFSELAVATSFIGFVYGLLSFFGDAWPKEIWPEKYGRLAKFGLVFVPPLLLSVLSPTIFFDAIEVAGAFGVSVLFGVLPALMVWKARYGNRTKLPAQPFVPGQKVMLVTMGLLAIAVLIEHTLQLVAYWY